MKNNVLIIVLFLSNMLSAQNNEQANLRDSALNIFIDCSNTFCDEDYIRQELPWVNYVRDRKLAQLHVLISSQPTASNGDEYLIDFFGLQGYDSLNFQLSYTSNSTQTTDEIRQGVISKIKMGLMPYIAMSTFPQDFIIQYESENELEEQVVEDKWKSWVIDLSADSWFNGQESTQSVNIWNNISVKKITDKWKYVFAFYNSYNENKFKFDNEIIRSYRKSNSFDAKVVRSLGEKTSFGLSSYTNSSTFNNTDLSSSIYSAIEYNFFPYSESSKRLLRVNYRVGLKYNDYTETTIYDEDDEFLYHQRVSLVLKLIQNWGSVSTQLYASNYLHDFNLNNLGFYSNLRVRIVKGLSVNLSGGADFIHDQINLPKGEATLEETLLQQRQLATQFSYFGSVGISYTFGSIYNNIVNPRFGLD